jgi:hypothetical protein
MPEMQSDKARRDAILDELKTAMTQYFDKESKRINDEATFIKSVIRGRTGSDRLRASNVTTARILVLDDITSFLTGDGA